MSEKKVIVPQPYTALANERYQIFEQHVLELSDETPGQEQLEEAVSAADIDLIDSLFIKTLGEKISFGEYLARLFVKEKKCSAAVEEDALIEVIQQKFRENGMYRLKLETLEFPAEMTRKEKEKWLFSRYEYTDIARSSKSIMGSIDFLSNTRTLDKKDLRDRLKKPVDKVTRDELFLFAFGLQFSVDEVTEFIRKYLGEPGFRWKDYKEFIYFWCLRNAKENAGGTYCGIKGVYNALRYYYKTPGTGSSSAGNGGVTYYYQERAAVSGRSDADFRAYLGMLKEKQPEHGYSVTRSAVLKKNLKRLHTWISEEQNRAVERKKSEYEAQNKVIESRGFSWQNRQSQAEKERLRRQIDNLDITKFEQDLWQCVNPDAKLIFDRDVICRISFPAIWRNASVGEKINSHTKDVTRKDILVSRFLYYAFKKEFGKQEHGSEADEYLGFGACAKNADDDWDDEDFAEMTDPLEIKEAFESVIELDLAECDMHAGLYLPNPFEMFLLLCLLTNAPYSVFMNAWSMAAGK